jgi:hypothetical protein
MDQLRETRVRPEIEVVQAPAPQRLAPHAAALTAEVVSDDEEIAGGRLVVLFDPEGQDAWEGDWRVVIFARAQLDPEMASDPVLCDVGWSWLGEAIQSLGVSLTAYGGTVTRTQSQPYGAMAGRSESGELEIRASWTPTDGRIGRHVAVWLQLLETMAGLEPELEGVTSLRR